MTKEKAREILKAKHYGDREESIKLIDEAIDYLLAQPEVIYCKDCTHYTDQALGWCDLHSHFDDNNESWIMFLDNDYCSDAERAK